MKEYKSITCISDIIRKSKKLAWKNTYLCLGKFWKEVVHLPKCVRKFEDDYAVKHTAISQADLNFDRNKLR